MLCYCDRTSSYVRQLDTGTLSRRDENASDRSCSRVGKVRTRSEEKKERKRTYVA